MENFNTFFDKLELGALRDCFARHGELRRYAKDEYFINQGEVNRYMGLIVKGYFKFVTLNSRGEESTMNFAFENDFLADFYASYCGKPSELSVVAGTAAEVLVVPYTLVNDFLMTADMGIGFYRSLYTLVYERHLELHRFTPRERYKLLLERFPRLIETVALKDIASYLLITPNHLSRIRNELAREG